MIECPKCGELLTVSDRTEAIICRCGQYIRREDFKEPSEDRTRSAPIAVVKRNDRNMQIMRERVAQIEGGAQAQLERARARKKEGSDGGA